MATVVGKIEPLEKIKEILNEKGITRFNAIGDINAFLKNYASEKKNIPNSVESKLDGEISHLKSVLNKKQQIHEFLVTEAKTNLLKEIKKLEKELIDATKKSNKNLFYKIIYYLKINKLKKQKLGLTNNSDNIIREKTHNSKQEKVEANNKLKDHIENKNSIISSRCDESYKELDHLKKVVDDLYPLIAGAIGENSTINELKKLPDNYYVINDFSAEFDPPIFNKKKNDRIFSIQIDHLLISRSGVFILETKNWSRSSIKNLDLRSPVEQILRSSYALFVLLNSESNIDLESHHWGSKKIPIRNIIVMTNEKPKEEFKHVKILSLKELTGYIEFFENIFNKEDTENIFNYLK